MKRIMTLFAALAVTLAVTAQKSDFDNYIGLTLHPAAGLNTMVCSPANGTHSLGIGIEAGLKEQGTLHGSDFGRLSGQPPAHALPHTGMDQVVHLHGTLGRRTDEGRKHVFLQLAAQHHRLADEF